MLSRDLSQDSRAGRDANLTLEAALILACSKADPAINGKDPASVSLAYVSKQPCTSS